MRRHLDIWLMFGCFRHYDTDFAGIFTEIREGLGAGHLPLVPAKAGTQLLSDQVKFWMPAFAGMSGVCRARASALLNASAPVRKNAETASRLSSARARTCNRWRRRS